jgi:16S rRNA (guanine527-N7)-methyltransferase
LNDLQARGSPQSGQAAADAQISQVVPDPDAAKSFGVYLDLLLKWNARMNLTAVREPGEIVRRHFAECIFAAQQVPSTVKTLLDFGSGGGLPGIPIAICRPKIAVTLSESQGKKAAFLRECVRTLGLRAEVWDQRVEQMPAGRVFDAVTLRAVDKMAEACRVAVTRLAPGGWMAVFATHKTAGELDHLEGIRWTDELPIPEMESGVIRTGLRM